MKVFRYLRERSSNLMNWLVKHFNIFVTACVTSIFFMALIFWMQLGHTKDSLSLIEDNIELESNIKNYGELVGAQSSYIEESNKVMDNQRMGLIKSESLIRMQQDLIKQLIERLKTLNAWPKDRPTRSEA